MKALLLCSVGLVLGFGGFGRTTAVAAASDVLRTYVNPDVTAGVYFGFSLTTVGNNVLASDRFGANYYLLSASTGEVLQTFSTPTHHWPPPVFYDHAVAVGNNVLIGVSCDYDVSHDDADSEDGAAYLFDGATGNLLHTFLHPTSARGTCFGASVAALGDNVLVGTPWNYTRGQISGAVYLLDGQTGGLLQTFLHPTPNSNAQFGQYVAAVGKNVLVGAPQDDTAAHNAGAAYLFDGESGELLHTFLNPASDYWSYFGEVLAAMGDNVLIGYPNDNTGATMAGAVYLYDGQTGNLLQTFLNPTPDPYDQFGHSVAAVGKNVLISAPWDDTVGDTAGAAYLFDGETGDLLKTFLRPTPAAGVGFGRTVAALGDNVLIGAPNDQTGGNHAGAVYLFDATPEPSTSIPEPSTLILLSMGAVGLLVYALRKRV